jgi:two-component system response regulator FixJ
MVHIGYPIAGRRRQPSERLDMSAPQPIVYVLDDEPVDAMRLVGVLESVKLEVKTYPDADAFLAQYTPERPACLILDVRMPRLSGFDVLHRLVQRDAPLPVIMVSRHADVPTAVRALRAGALDFMQKPYNDQTIIDRVQQAIRCNVECLAGRREAAGMAARWAELSPRERDVIVRVAAGASNQEIAEQLDVGIRTVETHRSNAMKKLELRFGAEFMRVVAAQDSGPTCARRDERSSFCCGCRARSMGDPSVT